MIYTFIVGSDELHVNGRWRAKAEWYLCLQLSQSRSQVRGALYLTGSSEGCEDLDGVAASALRRLR